jgi:hypothetical protein
LVEHGGAAHGDRGKPFAIYCRLSRKKPIKPGFASGRVTETVEGQEQECRGLLIILVGAGLAILGRPPTN